VTDPWDFFLWL